jgi:Transposase DDE domain
MSKTKVRDLLSLIDTGVLDKAAASSAVDYNVKKLGGEVMFKLLLMSLLDSGKMSLRLMEQLYRSNRFKLFAGLDQSDSIRYSSLSERLCCIDVCYFKEIFEETVQLSRKRLGNLDKYNIRQFDSTTISASARLLTTGMVNGLRSKEGEHRRRQIKVTVGLYKNLPSESFLFSGQKYLAEDQTLRQSILKAAIGSDEIVVFDRGLKSRKTFQEFSCNGISFVTRINATKSVKVLSQNPLPAGEQTATLALLSDENVHLFYEQKRKLKQCFRMIKARCKSTGAILFFLTNITALPAAAITDIYKQRWEIEVFFKFLKQHLHFKHFFSYSENGIQVMMYMSMIAALLLLLYKKENKFSGYKIAKYAFVEELELEIIKEIVLICGGDPAKSALFNTS